LPNAEHSARDNTEGFQMFATTRSLFQLSTVLVALAANACAAHDVRPLASSAAKVSCVGGLLQSASDVDLYRACDQVTGDLRISAPDLTDLSALARLKTVSGTLEISGNPQLGDLSGLEELQQVGALSIHDNAGLYRSTGLSGLSEVGQVVIERNPKLNSLRGLRSLTHAGSVQIRNNPRLCAFGMLPALARVDYDVTLLENRGLSRPDVHKLLDRVEHNLARPRANDVARFEASLR